MTWTASPTAIRCSAFSELVPKSIAQTASDAAAMTNLPLCDQRKDPRARPIALEPTIVLCVGLVNSSQYATLYHMLHSFAILTLGCKVNSYESQQIRQLLETSGWSRPIPRTRRNWWLSTPVA
jgi:hypothetical protein